MFGILRYILIQMVVIYHLISARQLLNLFCIGQQATFGFYLLSGYLITLVLQQKYSFSIQGIKNYLLSRFLRIYPTYFIVLLITILALLIFPPNFLSNISTGMQLPSSISEWLPNIFIFGATGLNNIIPVRVVPVVWMINVLLILYLLAFFIARSKEGAVIWFIISLAYTISMIGLHFPSYFRYFSVLAASLPFSLGSLAYWYRDTLRKIFRPWTLIITAPAFLVHGALAGKIWLHPNISGLYFSLFLSFVIVVALSQINQSKVPPWLGKIDKVLGGISYPIFLSHLLIATLLGGLYFNDTLPNNLNLFLVSFPFINIFSFLIWWFVDRKLEEKRKRLVVKADNKNISN